MTFPLINSVERKAITIYTFNLKGLRIFAVYVTLQVIKDVKRLGTMQ